MATKKQPASDKVDKLKKVCIICGEEFKDVDFYKSRSNMISERFSVCKQCACNIGNKDIDNMHKILMYLDVPFIPEILKEVEGMDNIFSQYMLRINNPKKKHTDGRVLCELKYSDSPTLEQVKDVDNYIYTSNEQLSELVSLFGDNWNKEELVSMDKELDEMFAKYGGKRDDIAMLDVYVELILTKWLSRKAYNLNDTKTGRELSKRRSEILKENGLSLSDIKNKGEEESLGSKIDFAEDRPIIPDKKYHDVDGIKFMWDKLCKHMERFIGVEKSSVDEDYEEMQAYVDEHGSYVDELE